ncbi:MULTISPECIES: HhH-GDP family DNA glycosylase [Streptomycetaceae]|uniref:Endonuclease III-like protein n=1 Tax=Streptantibioticus cattleyicolor (strain ATCC 35852 / DSM 46488 / JCM 4925 / NBRC 14057 / NRRL 8057) TaxID=1003195 RepID=F8JQG1_STREN|nr:MULTISPECIES: endonuclease [Streptomycetaceae]AEW97804.1 endonuclease III-like protein [Streptantibioticus cattleyicolor NRRL 8057 = DSM 46488]MYS62221.1 endonuclease [Streptomyces sp. SID5468]CCB78122.1 conserved protein of unknown function [Streptantibioticus cattleyicolor NRRL 8057 = DSM 46488]
MAVSQRQRETVRALLDEHGRTYAEEAGIHLKDTPQPLYQLVVLATLLSARIKAQVATAAARALFEAGLGDPRRMADADWQRRVDALGEGHYRRYDERTATQLGEGAALLLDRYGGDVRRMRQASDGDPDALRRSLREVPGIGPVGADIFIREAQSLWPEFGPFFDDKAVRGAGRVGLPTSPEELAHLAGRERWAALAAALVRSALDKDVAEEVGESAGHR